MKEREESKRERERERDDCLLYREINDQNDHHTLQNDLKNLEGWANTWGMRFNASKCYILSIKNSSNHFYQLNDTILKRVPTNPYLGLTISEDLKWAPHVNKIPKKANSTLGFIRRNLKRCPVNCRRSAYIALVRPLLEYGASVWDPHYQKDIDKLERVQKNAARFITGDYKSTTPGSVSRLLEKCNLPPLQERRRHLRLSLYYRVVEGLAPALPPEKFLQQQRPGRLIRTRQLDGKSSNPVNNYARHNDKPYAVPHCNTIERQNSFFPRTTVDWNRLENEVVHADSINRFRALVAKTR